MYGLFFLKKDIQNYFYTARVQSFSKKFLHEIGQLDSDYNTVYLCTYDTRIRKYV